MGRFLSLPLSRAARRRVRRRSRTTVIHGRSSPEPTKSFGRRGLLADSHHDSLCVYVEHDEANPTPPTAVPGDDHSGMNCESTPAARVRVWFGLGIFHREGESSRRERESSRQRARGEALYPRQALRAKAWTAWEAPMSWPVATGRRRPRKIAVTPWPFFCN